MGVRVSVTCPECGHPSISHQMIVDEPEDNEGTADCTLCECIMPWPWADAGPSDALGAVLYDSLTDWSFGPAFESLAEAEAFLVWYDQTNEAPVPDLRSLPDAVLDNLVTDFRRER